MNQTTYFVFGIYQLNLLLRDSLEYMVPNRQYSLELYDKRKEGLLALTSEMSPLGRFLDLNKDKAEQIKNSFKNFIEQVYSENATIVKKIDGAIEVDNALKVPFYEMATGIFQTVEDIIYGYINHAKTANQYEEYLEKAVYNNELYFRSLSYFAVFLDLFAKFNELQTAFRESQGQPTPAGNFINDEISKLIGILRFQKQHSKITDVGFNEMVDKVNAFIETMAGRRKLPEGLKFPDYFAQVRDEVLSQLQKSEIDFKNAFAPILKDYIAFTQKLTDAQNQNKEELS